MSGALSYHPNCLHSQKETNRGTNEIAVAFLRSAVFRSAFWLAKYISVWNLFSVNRPWKHSDEVEFSPYTFLNLGKKTFCVDMYCWCPGFISPDIYFALLGPRRCPSHLLMTKEEAKHFTSTSSPPHQPLGRKIERCFPLITAPWFPSWSIYLSIHAPIHTSNL